MPLFHLLGSDPVVDRFGRIRWATHRTWTLASCFGVLQQGSAETPCGCGLRVTVRYASMGTEAERRVQRWFARDQPRAHPYLIAVEGHPDTGS